MLCRPSLWLHPTQSKWLTISRQAIGGTLWHGIKGFRNSPYGERGIGAITAVKMRAPVLGGNFGVWGGLFSTFDCAMKGMRKKEDPWNAIGAGFMTGGSLAIRGGFKAARNGAIGCAVLLAVIEGVGIGFQKMMAGGTKLEVSFTVALLPSLVKPALACLTDNLFRRCPLLRRRTNTLWHEQLYLLHTFLSSFWRIVFLAMVPSYKHCISEHV
jgi:import inner membrane translocase subunit TIM17